MHLAPACVGYLCIILQFTDMSALSVWRCRLTMKDSNEDRLR
jgi:hypothetical protein